MLQPLSYGVQIGQERSEKLDLIKVLSAHTQVRTSEVDVWVFLILQCRHGMGLLPYNLICQQKAKPRCNDLQVVAGTNYKLILDVANSANKHEHIEATVYGALMASVHRERILLRC